MRRGGSTGLLTGVVGLLAVIDLVLHVGPPQTSLFLGTPVAVALLLVGRAAGLDRDDLGLGGAAFRRGAVYGLGAAGVVAAFYVVVLSVPVTRSTLLDPRDDVGAGTALLTALVLIPIRTVLLEEVAFRGVVWALICRDRGPAVATVVSGVLFGLWHVLPSLGVGNTGAESGVRWPALVGTVVFTGLAGLVFGELRRRSGSLLAPALLHWATNGLGVLASAAAWWLSRC